MIKLHWMQRGEDDTPSHLRTLSNVLDDAGYESVLLVYHSLLPDYMIKIANIINTEHKLKYMFAIRTYAISPEYMAMICKSFNEIDFDRIVINVCAGDFQQDENSANDVVEINDLMQTYEGRVEYTTKWIDKFLSLPYLEHKPKLIISGTSEKSLKNAEIYSDHILAMKSSYLDGLRVKVNGKMAATRIIIRDTTEEAKLFVDNEENRMMKLSSIYGTEEEVVSKINKLEALGITDVLCLKHPDDEEHYRIHSMVKKINSNKLGA